MRPDKSDGPKSHCCSCLLVWNSVKDYWERLYGSVVYSITKLLIGMLLSTASPKSVRAQSDTFIFVVGRFWGLCSVFIIPGMPVWIRRLKVVDRTVIHPYCALTIQDTWRTLTFVMKIRGTKMPLSWVRLLTNKDETIKMKLSTKMKRGWSRGVGVTDMFLFRSRCTFLVRPNL